MRRPPGKTSHWLPQVTSANRRQLQRRWRPERHASRGPWPRSDSAKAPVEIDKKRLRVIPALHWLLCTADRNQVPARARSLAARQGRDSARPNRHTDGTNDERAADDCVDGRGVQGQPRSGRMGRRRGHPRRPGDRAWRRRADDDEQQDGTDWRHPGVRPSTGTAGPVAVYTDSTYVIQGIREWVHNWKRRGWKTATGTEVMNRELWEQLSELTTARGARTISWHYVRGHIGIPGNERVDEIADSFAMQTPVVLYEGPLSAYPIAILDLPDDTSVPARSKSPSGGRNSKAPAYSYLSVVDGKPMRHATWAECEQRVKGRSGARFKKATSAAEQDAILRAWRFRPEDV